jgi:L-threonylcarbamoyladenylate synthase
MERIPVRPDRAEGRVIEQAVARLRAGGVMAYPAEALYGLGVDIRQTAAVARLIKLKGQPAGKPISVVVSDREMLEKWVRVPQPAEPLIAAYWPGPLTLILPARPLVPPVLLGSGSGLGIRVPGIALLRELCRALGAPITATSANLSGTAEPRTSEQVARALGHGLDLLLDAGPLPEGKASTVLDLSGEEPRLIREGAITREMLAPYLH